MLPAASAGPSFHAGHRKRVVPRHDRPDDAERLAGDDGGQAVRRRPDLTVNLVDRLSEPADASRSRRDIAGFRIDQWLADIERLERRQLVTIMKDQLRKLQQHLASILRRHARPGSGFERLARGAHGCIDVRRFARRHMPDRSSVAGEDAGQCAAALRVDIASIYEGLRRKLHSPGLSSLGLPCERHPSLL